jgi:hypothetical protein
MSSLAVRDACGDGSGERRCPAPNCRNLVTSARAQYCSDGCRMRAFRERRLLASSRQVIAKLTPQAPVGAFVYECANCGERYLGERRCPECHLFNRNLGLGGSCPDCDRPIVLAELLPGLDLPAGRAARR